MNGVIFGAWRGASSSAAVRCAWLHYVEDMNLAQIAGFFVGHKHT